MINSSTLIFLYYLEGYQNLLHLISRYATVSPQGEGLSISYLSDYNFDPPFTKALLLIKLIQRRNAHLWLTVQFI